LRRRCLDRRAKSIAQLLVIDRSAFNSDLTAQVEVNRRRLDARGHDTFRAEVAADQGSIEAKCNRQQFHATANFYYF
jgi:hypothetical protein